MKLQSSYQSVLDASAVLAYLQREPGHEQIRGALDQGAAISTVNLAEVYAKAVASGQELEAVADRLLALGLGPQPFTEPDARAAAELYLQTRVHGLSLGDRACLALGLQLGLPVLTADRTWTELQLAIPVHLVR